MSKIASVSVQIPTRHEPVRAAAPVVEASRPVEAAPVSRTVAPAEPPAARVAAPAARIQTIAVQTMAALLQVQAKAQAPAQPISLHLDPQPAHGRDNLHGHAAPPPPVSAPPVVRPPAPQPAPPPVSFDPNPTHGEDDQHGHKPPPVPPPHVQPVAYDPLAPARTIAMISNRLKDSALQEQARATVAAQRAEAHAAVTVAQGKAAMAIFQAMEAQWQQWQDHGAASKSPGVEPFRPLHA